MNSRRRIRDLLRPIRETYPDPGCVGTGGCTGWFVCIWPDSAET